MNPFGFALTAPSEPRRGPQDIPAAPFGFAPPPTKWEQTKDILAPYVMAPVNAWKGLMDADLNTLLFDTGPAGRQAVENSFDVAGSFAGGSSVVPKPKNALNMGIRAYHGSPHDFPPVRLIEMPDGQRLYQNMNELPDTPQGARIIQEFPLGRFDMSKMGTGEGAQAYGHGLYFAENEGVAKGYKSKLSYKHLRDRFLEELPQDADFADVEDLMAGGFFTPDQTRFLTELKNNDWLGFDYPSQAITAAARGKLDNYDPTPELADAASKLGHTYEVRINADPDTFLDWDKPLSEQPEAVKQAFIAQKPEYADWWNQYQNDPQVTGEMVARSFGNPGDGNIMKDMAAAKSLREAGIPGIKFLDAGSRGAGDGTRNYVVFDDRLIEIVRKYGIAGASAMFGYNILDGMDPAQAEELKKLEGNQ